MKVPPFLTLDALTSKGTIYHGGKNQILNCTYIMNLDNSRPVTTAAVLDGAVLFQMLCP